MANLGKRSSEEQIIAILKEAAVAAAQVGAVIRRHGVAPKIYCRWKSKSGGTEVSEARRLKQLEEENRGLRRLVADQALDIQLLEEALGKE